MALWLSVGCWANPLLPLIFFLGSVPPSLHPHGARPTRQTNSKRFHPVTTECSRFSAEGCWNRCDSAQTVHIVFAEYNQQDATFHSLFISVRRSTCFGRFFRPSSGAHNCIYCVRFHFLSFFFPLLYRAIDLDI